MLHCKAFTVKVEFVLKVMCLYIETTHVCIKIGL